MQERTALDDQLNSISRVEQELDDQLTMIELGEAENDPQTIFVSAPCAPLKHSFFQVE